MATPDEDKNKVNPVDQYNQQAIDYRKQATDLSKQSADYDKQLSTLPEFDHEKFYEDWKSGKKPIAEALMSNYKKPEPEISPEMAEKAKFGAALTDSLSSLAEMVASGRGAHIRNRGNDPTSTQTTNQRLEQLKNKYDQEMLNYNNTKGNAEYKDFSEQLQDAMKEKGQKREYLLYKSKKAQAESNQATKESNQLQKNANDYALKLKDQGIKGDELKEKVKEFNQKQALDWYDAKTKRAKEMKDSKDDASGLIINAHPSDPYVQTDALGNRVKQLKLSKEQITGLANTAKYDADFLTANPDVYVDEVDLMGHPHKGLTTDHNLAWKYAQYKYNQNFSTPHPTDTQQNQDFQYLVPVGQNNNGGQAVQQKITGNIR